MTVASMSSKFIGGPYFASSKPGMYRGTMWVRIAAWSSRIFWAETTALPPSSKPPAVETLTTICMTPSRRR